MTDVKQHTIARFNEKHDLSVDSQFRQLVEELGELADVLDEDDGTFTFFERVSNLGETAERLNREHEERNSSTPPTDRSSVEHEGNEHDFGHVDDEQLAEELADVVFVARSMAEMRDINLTKQVNAVAEENLEKDESTDGAKVTKDGLTDGGEHTEDRVTAEDIRSWPSHDGVTYTAYVATEPPLGDVGDNVAYDTVERENTTVSFDCPEAGGGHIWVSAPGEATTVHEPLDADEDPFEVAAEIIEDEDIGVEPPDQSAQAEAEALLDEFTHPWEDDPRLERDEEQEKPCGEYHPLACGVDRECSFVSDDEDAISIDTDDPAIEERLRQLKRDIDDQQVNVKLQRAIELWIRESQRDSLRADPSDRQNREARETTYGVTDD